MRRTEQDEGESTRTASSSLSLLFVLLRTLEYFMFSQVLCSKFFVITPSPHLFSFVLHLFHLWELFNGMSRSFTPT